MSNIVYDKDVSLLCPSTVLALGVPLPADDVAVQRSLLEDSTINFSIRKSIRSDTYVYTVDELTVELRARIINAIESRSFAEDIIAAVELYDAALIQTALFKNSIRLAKLSTIRNAVVVHLPYPSCSPSTIPTVHIVQMNFEHDDTAESVTLALSLSSSVVCIIMCLLCWCLYKNRKETNRKKFSIYASPEDAKVDDLQKSILLNFSSHVTDVDKIMDLSTDIVNRAFLYIKPHANNIVAQSLVRDYLCMKYFNIVAEGDIPSSRIQSGFEKQYREIRRYALLLKPHEMLLSSMAMMNFEKKFAINWKLAVKQNLIRNSSEICSIFDVSEQEFMAAWLTCACDGKMVKLGRGFYCGLIDSFPNKPAVFCTNGFFQSMHTEYVTANSSVHYFLVEWDNAAMSWDEFRKKIVGVTNPAVAHPESLRSIMNSEWAGLGLDAPLDLMRNGLHASASAFEAMVERSIWLDVPATCDPLGVHLYNLGFSVNLLNDWMSNTVVDGQTLFDHMENQGCVDCITTAKSLHHMCISEGTFNTEYYIILYYVQVHRISSV